MSRFIPVVSHFYLGRESFLGRRESFLGRRESFLGRRESFYPGYPSQILRRCLLSIIVPWSLWLWSTDI